MKVKTLIKELRKYEKCQIVHVGHPTGNFIADVVETPDKEVVRVEHPAKNFTTEVVEAPARVILIWQSRDVPWKPVHISVKTIITLLQKMNPDADVYIPSISGLGDTSNKKQVPANGLVLFVCASTNGNDVWLETEADVNVADQIEAAFNNAIEEGVDELDVYTSFLEVGIDVEMMRKYRGEEDADHMQKFCEEHGLL